MHKQSFNPLNSSPQNRWENLLIVLKHRLFWTGVLGIVGMLLVVLLLMNFIVFPSYTRQGTGIHVPAVVEKPFDEAVQLLTAQGLLIERRNQYHNQNYDVGIVLEQRPIANALVKPGRVITLFVNGETKRDVTVPDVIRLKENEAIDRIREAGLEVGDIKVDSTSTLPANTIVRQSPKGGEVKQMGSRVNLWVSVGVIVRQVTVPDLYDMPLEDARMLIESLDLKFEISFATEGLDHMHQVVIRQEPVAGTGLDKGGTVRVSAGPALVEPPPEEGEEKPTQEDRRFDF